MAASVRIESVAIFGNFPMSQEEKRIQHAKYQPKQAYDSVSLIMFTIPSSRDQ